jgi:hypothetical protein
VTVMSHTAKHKLKLTTQEICRPSIAWYMSLMGFSGVQVEITSNGTLPAVKVTKCSQGVMCYTVVFTRNGVHSVGNYYNRVSRPPIFYFWPRFWPKSGQILDCYALRGSKVFSSQVAVTRYLNSWSKYYSTRLFSV